MKQIPLKNSQRVALVDDHWYDSLNRFEWHEQKSLKTSYAYVRIRSSDGKTTILFMHRIILGLPPGDTRNVDHANRVGTDNQASNLRIATPSQNQANRGLFRSSTSGYKGVSPNRPTGKWQAAASRMGRPVYLGLYATKVEAAIAYNCAATTLYGEFALLNPIPAEAQPDHNQLDTIYRQVLARLSKKLPADPTTSLPRPMTCGMITQQD